VYARVCERLGLYCVSQKKKKLEGLENKRKENRQFNDAPRAGFIFLEGN
jgi:hypothetical protein